jgi:hypothetical protein
MNAKTVALCSLVFGAAMLIVTALVTIEHRGVGLADPYAWQILSIAGGVAWGAVVLGRAWSEGRKTLAVMLCLAMAGAEAFGFLQTAERIVADSEGSQAPARDAQADHDRASKRVTEAETALSAIPNETARLKRALQAKKDADSAALAKSAEKGCVANCRALLEQQVQNAINEVTSARAEIEAMRRDASAELANARKALEAVKAPASGTPLADRIGMPAWKIDLLKAGLGSLAANGLGALLIAYGAHQRHKIEPKPAPDMASAVAAAPVAVKKTSRPPTKAAAAVRQIADQSPEARRQHAAQFGVECLKPDPAGVVTPGRLVKRYTEWCEAKKIQALPAPELASELNALFATAGIQMEKRGNELVVRGVSVAA